MLATLVTSADTPDDVVYAVTKEVMTNLDQFRKLHPALANLTPESMLQGLTAPIHPALSSTTRSRSREVIQL